VLVGLNFTIIWKVEATKIHIMAADPTGPFSLLTVNSGVLNVPTSNTVSPLPPGTVVYLVFPDAYV
jgi:hypothetical protein